MKDSSSLPWLPPPSEHCCQGWRNVLVSLSLNDELQALIMIVNGSNIFGGDYAVVYNVYIISNLL